jgi:uncharacterized protein YozE (UPF0346 family)
LNVRVSPNFFDNVDGRDANPDRHYVHGDQVEGSQDHYYCAHCDMFVASDHFEGEHPGASEGRYFSSLNAWQRTPAENKINTRRPASAINILAATALASREAKEAARSDFHRWLELQVDRNDPVGDLAKDVAHDVGFPSSAKSKKIIRSYLAGAQASGSALEAFEAAWKEFALSGK